MKLDVYSLELYQKRLNNVTPITPILHSADTFTYMVFVSYMTCCPETL